ncbi:mucin-5AC [Wyeomyia smithii]|uniref:mucin-5AC n=1 Tax=Wyeomyia smithii TaxID=174621 RepID=UPI002467F9AB|nr:mucin-5AC [Wyeomyia smithii]
MCVTMGRTRMSVVLLVVLIACKLGDPARSNGSDGSDSAKPVPPESTTAGSERRGAPSTVAFSQPRQREVRNGVGEASIINRGWFANDAVAVAAAAGTTASVSQVTTTTTTPSTSVSSQLDSRSSVPAATDNLNDTSTTTPATFAPSKRRSVNRDNKLMSVLQARRTALSRDRWQKEYVPPSVLKLHRHNNPTVNLVEDSSTPESNLIIPPGSRPDEFLDTDESIHGMYVVNPRNGKVAASPQIRLAKETNNLVAQHSNKSIESTKLTSAKQISARGSYYEPRAKRTRDRKTLSTSTERPVEDGDLIPYQYFGQKLIPTSRNADSRNQVLNPKGTRLTKLKDDSQEIMEVSAPKTSTEKNKFWQNRLAYQSRNVVAFNNYLRRSKDGLYGVTPVQTSTTTVASSTRGMDSAVHADSLTNSMIALSNLSEGTIDSKQVFSRSANFTSLNKTEMMVQSSTVATSLEEKPVTTTTASTTQSIPANHKPDDELPALFSPTGQAAISKLIINYPDDATPEDLYHPNSYQPVPEHAPVTTTAPPETTFVNMEEFENHRNMVSIPDINHIFQNLSTSPTTTTTTGIPMPVKRISQVDTIVETADASTENVLPVMTTTASSTEQTQDVTTAPPPEPSSTTRTTESTTLATSTTTLAPAPFSLPPTTPSSSTTTTTTTTTTPSTTTTKVKISTYPDVDTEPPYETDDREPQQPNSTRFNPVLPHVLPKLTRDPIPQSRVPTIVDYNTSPSGMDNRGNAATKKPTIAFEGVLLQHNSDVVIEMRKMNTATFILAGLGMLPIVIIILYVIKAAVCKREHKVSHDLERYISDGQPPISPVVRLEQSDTSSVADESIITDRDFNRKNLRFKSLLGEGNFGQVWKAEADDLAGHFGTTRIVAVKTERSDNGHGDLKAEAEIMRKLGSHPNVVTLLGVCLEQEPQLLIMEYAMRGRLLSLLRAARGAVNGLAPSAHGNRPPIMPLSPRRLTGFAHDIARGMEYISEKKIVHRDLAARNVLLDHNGICKICDFGMSIDLEKIKSSQAHIRIPRSHQSESRFKFDLSARSFGIGRHHNHEGFGRHGHGRGHDSKSRPALPIRWMAPEALQYHIFSRETDVWAFGIVLWEITTLGCTPYPNLSGREVVRNVPNGIRPDIPPDCRPELYDLMHRTWRKDPRQRPSFSEARTSLARTLCQWQLEETDTSNTSEYLDVSGFSEDLEQGMVYFNRRISEFECEI